MDYRSLKSAILGLALLSVTSQALAYDVPTLGASQSITNPRRAGEAGTGIFSDATQVVGIAAGGRTAAKFLFVSGGSNWLTFTPSNSGDPLLGVDGGSTNPGIIINSKGTGNISFKSGGVLQAQVIGRATSVNYLKLVGVDTGLPPSVTAAGTDTNVGLGLTTQGTGAISLTTGGGRQVRVSDTASAVNYVNMTGAATGSGPTISADGSDTDENLNLNPKGAGNLASTGYLTWAGQNRVATQVDKTNNTLGNVTGLTASMKSGKTYHFRSVLHVTADVTGGHKYAVTSSGTVSAIIYEILSTCNTTNLMVITSRQTSLGGSVGQAGCTDPYTVIDGTVTTSAAGTFAIQFSENASSGTSSVLVGSYLELQLVN